MLFNPGKVLCSLILQHRKTKVGNILREKHAGFQEGRSCSDQIFTRGNVVEQCQELQTLHVISYIDFKKFLGQHPLGSNVADCLSVRMPSKYVNIFRALDLKSTCTVTTNSGITEDWHCDWHETGLKCGSLTQDRVDWPTYSLQMAWHWWITPTMHSNRWPIISMSMEGMFVFGSAIRRPWLLSRSNITHQSISMYITLSMLKTLLTSAAMSRALETHKKMSGQEFARSATRGRIRT